MRPGNIAHYVMTRRFILNVRVLATSVCLSLLFMGSAIFYTIVDFLILIILSISLSLSWTVMTRMNIFNDEIKPHFIKISSAALVSFIFSGIYIYISFHQTPPGYLDDSLSQTIKNASSLIYSSCDIINMFVKLVAEITAIKWWLMIELSINYHNKLFLFIFWIVFFLGNFGFYYTFARCYQQIAVFIKYLTEKGSH